MIVLPEWPHSLGTPESSGIIRSSPEDFVVHEIPRVIPEGEGSHLWLWVEKRSANTDWVARELARLAGCPQRDVGYAGLKDRHAITRQWFSIPLKESGADMSRPEEFSGAGIEGVKILERCRHGRKLKRGTLNGNRFRLTIRQLLGDAKVLEHRLAKIGEFGVPNYFGPQRFGHAGRNVQQGLDLLQKKVALKRHKKSIYLSAIRSFLFNHVLAERVRRASWNTILNGELAMLDGTQSVFSCEKPDEEIEERCRRLDIHPSGPMPGDSGTQASGEAFKLEQDILQTWPEFIAVLVSQRVKASRRALRLCPEELEWSVSDDCLELTFSLPPGTYATVVLRELLDFTEATNTISREP